MDLTALISDYSEAFDTLCQERHIKGQQEYGHFTFVGNDVVRMMMEELADTANYCRMQFIKLMMLQHALEGGEELKHEGKAVEIGIESFKGTSETGWGR